MSAETQLLPHIDRDSNSPLLGKLSDTVWNPVAGRSISPAEAIKTVLMVAPYLSIFFGRHFKLLVSRSAKLSVHRRTTDVFWRPFIQEMKQKSGSRGIWTGDPCRYQNQCYVIVDCERTIAKFSLSIKLDVWYRWNETHTYSRLFAREDGNFRNLQTFDHQ